MLFARALLAFLILPVFFGGLVPWWLRNSDPSRGPASVNGSVIGWPVMILGLAILLMCVWDFYRFGKGTLAPWDPPKTLVIVGLYRYVRNPMYVGMLVVLVGFHVILRR